MKKNTIQLLSVAFIVAIATACARVPVTKVTFNPESKSIDFSGPKDVSMKGLSINWVSATATNKASFTATMESFEAKNNIELFRAVVAQNSEMARRVSEGSANFLGTIVEHMK